MRVLFIVSVSIAWALPNRDAKTLGQERNVAGVASNIVTSTILKGNIDNQDNFVFSPLGFSSILAILSEGARGQTYDEINEILRLPNDRNAQADRQIIYPRSQRIYLLSLLLLEGKR
uniref:Serpin domain-containing protein n=1 Tax=Phlebotomus papatasi TaxID=29031 RepID=A0A1B0DIB6_PHLPP